MRRFVIGDIHGRFKALIQLLVDCKFDPKEDLLIVLGDIVDGGSRSYEVIDALIGIPNLVYIYGNHDIWFIRNIKTGWYDEVWIQQGGANTMISYGAKVKQADRITEQSLVDTTDMNVPVSHQSFLDSGVFYFLLDDMIFVHGGFNPKIPKIESQSTRDLLWDRHLIRYAQKHVVPNYKKVFVGHTSTQSINGTDYPQKFNNLIMMDCGAGWDGRLAIMDIDTEEYWLSEKQKSPIS